MKNLYNLINKKKYIFYILIFLLSIIRFVVTLRLPPYIIANASYDDLWMIEKGWNILCGKWLGTYNHTALIKGCFSPILVAFSYRIGVPFQMLNTVLYIFACLFFAWAVSPFIKSIPSLLFLITILLFNPIMMALHTYQRIYRNGIMQWLLLVMFGCIFYIYLHKNEMKKIIIMGTLEGLVFWAIYNVREDSVWILPFVIVSIFVTIVVYLIQFHKKMNFNLVPIIACFFVPLLVYGMLTTSVLILNKHYYGKGLLNDRTKGGYFPKVVTDLLRIDTDETNAVSINDINSQYPFITRKAFEMAYSVSPTLEKIKEDIDGALNAWAGGVGKEVFLDHSVFALRDGVSQAGFYSSLVESELFYKSVHEELTCAFKSKKIKEKKALIVTNAGVLTKQRLKEILRIFPNAVFKDIVDFKHVSVQKIYPIPTEQREMIDFFEMMTGVSFSEITSGKLKINGWFFSESGDLIIRINNHVLKDFNFLNSEDVYNFFLNNNNKEFENAKKCRFQNFEISKKDEVYFLDSENRILGIFDGKEERFRNTAENFHFAIDSKESDENSKWVYEPFLNRVNKIIYLYQHYTNIFLILAMIFNLFLLVKLILLCKRKIFNEDLFFFNLAQTGIVLSFILFVFMILYVSVCSFWAMFYLYTNSAHLMILIYIALSFGYTIDKLLGRLKRLFVRRFQSKFIK